jgi:DNA helicase II / ATP-dependent DNA helicase PcrA
MSLLDDLNPVQRKAVLETDGPLLIFAGAGSGKTRVLTYRIAYLIQEKGVSPWNILAVTFTNKAAEEMRERVERLLGRGAKGAWISTFHSACVRVLRRNIERLGYGRNFVIYDDQDQERHLKAVMKELDLNPKLYPPRAVLSAIDHLKNQGVTPEQYIPAEFNIFQKKVGLIYRRYQENLHRNNALDFGDLLNFVVVLFSRFPDVLRLYQEQFHHVLVDEFQDTNLVQYHLIKQIGKLHRNICVVGDDDQSIYRWRGAEVGNILNFGKDFPDSKIVTLEQNYRSTQTILTAANRMVSTNRQRKAKTLWTENPEGEMLTFYSAEDETDEARFVLLKIKELCQPSPGGASEQPARAYREISVFYRINAQSRAIEEELVRNRIPYTIVGGMKFYERKEIKDILAYLKLIANPSDSLSLRRIINLPPRGLGEKTLDKMDAFSREKGLSLYEGLKEALRENRFSPALQGKMQEFVDLIEELRSEIKMLSVSKVALAVLSRTGYLQRLKDERTDEAISRIENIEELVNVMMEFEGGPEEGLLEAFLDRASLVSDVDLWEDKGNRISLMTLHCAKGLEFPIVFIIGVEEGILPHARRGEEIEDLEEERRLFYVGITRAKEKLFLSRAEKRFTFGVGRANLASRFLDEIPSELMAFEERRRHQESFFSQERDEEFPSEELEIVGDQDFPVSDPSTGDFSPPGENRLESEIVLSPEGFYPLKIGMRVRHPKFGDGRVKAVEGRDENQKATILFPTVGAKRIKVCYAQLEILE